MPYERIRSPAVSAETTSPTAVTHELRPGSLQSENDPESITPLRRRTPNSEARQENQLRKFGNAGPMSAGARPRRQLSRRARLLAGDALVPVDAHVVCCPADG